MATSYQIWYNSKYKKGVETLMYQDFMQGYATYIPLFLIAILIVIIYFLIQVNKKIKALDRRVEIIENFEKIINYLTSNVAPSNQSANLSDDNHEEETEEYGIYKTEKKYEGKTEIDRLVKEYLDLAVHKKNKK